MITYVYGDIFYSPARAIVNPVNTVGAIGNQAGIAYDFRRFFPQMYEAYVALCQQDKFTIGQLFLYRTAHKWVLNIPTKRHYRAHATPETIEQGLKTFASVYATQNITSVSFPAFGTAEDELDWDDLRPLMESYLHPLPISVFIHMYDTASPFAQERRSTRAIRHWLNNIPQQVSFDSFWNDLLQIAKQDETWQTLDNRQAFTVKATTARGRQRLSLKIIPQRGESIYLTETQLRDLWQYCRRAGYIMPQNLPAGLDSHAEYIVALLAQLDTMHAVRLATVHGSATSGLQYIPPVQAGDDARHITLTR